MHQMKTGDISIQWHANQVPPYAEAELERLYQSIYSSLKHFSALGWLDRLATYEVRRDGVVIALLLVRHDMNHVKVMNEVMCIDAVEITRFVEYVFSTFKQVMRISFQSIQTSRKNLSFPCQCVNHLEDIVISLPDQEEKYLTMLGSATRKTIKKYIRRMKGDFPSFELRVFTNAEISRDVIEEIFALKCARMLDKKEVFAHADDKKARALQLAPTCGLVTVIMVDGKICAGSISYRAGDHYFLEVSTHDPKFNDYRLGTICCFFSICECIRRGGTECHLLWGRSEYKFRLLGVQRDLDRLVVYRSRVWQLRHCDEAFVQLFQMLRRRIRTWLPGSPHVSIR